VRRKIRTVAVAGISDLLGERRSSFHLLDDLLELSRHFRNWGAGHFHSTVGALARDQVEGAVGLVLLGIVVAEMPAPTLFPFEGAARHRFRDRQQVVEVERGMPARVVLAMAADADSVGSFAQRS